MRRLTVIFLLLLLLTGCGERIYTSVQTEPPAALPAVTEAPTELPTEPPTEASAEIPTVAPGETADEELVRIIDYIPSIREELAYGTAHNFTGQRIYDFTESYLRYGTVKKLKQASELLAERGLGLLVWDAFRPVAAQQKLWDICPDPAYVSHPVTGNRSHCRGSAVDVTLVELETGEQLEMPTGFDDFTAMADRDYSDCLQAAAENARLLEEIMVSCGFRPYSAEWWHFADTNEYPVEETFNPAGVG